MKRFATEASASGHRVHVFTVRDAQSTQSDSDLLAEQIDEDPVVHTVPLKEVRRSIVARAVEQVGIATCVAAQALLEGVRGGKPDVIVVTVPALPSAVSGWLVSRLLGAPLVIDLRDAWPDLISEIGDWEHEYDQSGPARWFQNGVLKVAGAMGSRVLRLSYKSASFMTTTSEWLSRSLRDAGIEKIEAIRNSPVRGKRITTGSFDRRRDPNRLRLLYAGTVGRAQGLVNLVEAVQLANQSGAAIDLQIVGEGAEENLVRSAIDQRSSAIHFDGPVNSEEMDQYYDWCQLAVVHLRPWEPLRRTIPSKLIEIIDREIPVLMVASGESAEIVEDLQCGYVAAPGDVGMLAEVLQNLKASEIEQISFAEANDWIDRFCDPAENSQKFLRVLESVFDSSSADERRK